MQVVVQLSLHATGIVFVVLLVQFALGSKLSARSRYALWGILVARLLIPWNYEVPVLSESQDAPGGQVVAVQPTPKVKQVAAVPRSIGLNESVRVAPTPVETSPPIATPVVAEPPAAAASPAPQPTFALPKPATLAMGLWLLGLVSIPSAILFSHLRMTRRLLRSSTAPPGWVMDTLEDLRTEFRIVAWPTILMTSEVHSPTLVGASHPKIFLPSKLVEESTPDEMRLFLLHELTHLRSGDIWFSWLWCLALSIHWFNPLMWWAGTRIRKDRELACDESVLRRIGADAKDDYARALLQAVSHLSEKSRQRYQFGLAGIAESKSEMKRRIESILAPIVRSRRLRIVGALTLSAILCASFVQLVPVAKIIEAQETGGEQAKKETPVELSAFIKAVDTQMQMIENRHARGDAYRDKSDLTSVYGEWKQENPTTPEAELEQMIRDLSTYAEAHADNEIYGWRVWKLKSQISRNTKDEPSPDDGIRPSFNYLWEATAHYPRTKYPNPSKHSVFQHLVNELAMMVWDKDGLDAAEEYLVETWKIDRRFVFFYDSPWQQRMEKEGISLDRLARLQSRLGAKAPLQEIQFLLTPEGLVYEGKYSADFAAVTEKLGEISNPYDHYISMGITTEDISLKQFREATENFMRVTADLGFDHFSDIGIQPSDDVPPAEIV
jgi:beta-lactamase regulating signal transducer with metallopeptidase domain